MSLSLEWHKRLDQWRKELPNHFYTELAELALEGFVTSDQLTPEQARQRSFEPFPPGKTWGAKWEYAWFRCHAELPAEAAGLRIALRLGVNAHSVVWINGELAGAWDGQHCFITLATDGKPGQAYDILVESYAGHGPTPCAAGPMPPGRVSVPEPPAAQRHVAPSSIGIWQEDTYQLAMDVETLAELRHAMDDDSLRVQEIDAALRDFTAIVAYELDRDAFAQRVAEARKRLAPLLEKRNGSTVPTMYAFGHAHLDVAWLWPLAETERKAARTLANQLALAAEYPEYPFLHSQAHLYWMVQNRYPALFEKVKAAVKKGNVIADGGMWVEADTNVSGGEALIRQFLYGKRYFREQFGVESELLWLPDVFGYSGAMPQIMAGCGVKYFSTQKIFWTYNGGDPFPKETFWWEGIDGSAVLVQLHNDYNAQLKPVQTIKRWKERRQKDGYSIRAFPFGWGDGGGGPTREHLEIGRRMADLEGCPKVKFASPAEFFSDLVKLGPPDDRYVGELYFQCHRGTLTSQAKTKKGNRKSELALREAEAWSAIASALSGYAVPAERFEANWRAVLLNQFHDILPGSSIQRVYEEAEASYAQVIADAQTLTQQAAGALVGDGQPGGAVTVLNSLSWPRTEVVALPGAAGGAVDAEGHALPVQVIDGQNFVEVTVPACGWTSVKLAEAGPAVKGGVKATAAGLENDQLRVKLDRFGRITSIFDKQTRREWAKGLCNELLMFRDVPTNFEAWDIDSTYQAVPVPLDAPAEIEVLAEGPLLGAVRVRRKVNESMMEQVIRLRRGSRRVDFDTVIDWQERQKLLKVAFDVDVHAHEAIHEIQFGHLRRPNHASRPYDADRFEVANHKWSALAEENRGFGVLNDCKYGLNVIGSSIRLTLLRAPLAPDMHADRGRQSFTYSFYAWNGSLAECGVVREGYQLNVPVVTVDGDAGGRCVLSLDADNLVLEALKVAEDGSGDLIARLYESKRCATRATLRTDLPIVSAGRCDMLENVQKELKVKDGAVQLDFRAFEIQTLRLRLK